MGAVTDGICLALSGMVQKPVNEDRPIRCHPHRRLHVIRKALVMVHHFHAPASQHIGGTHHHRITDPVGDLQGLLHCGGHTGLRHGPEQIPVLCQVNDGRGRTQDPHAVFLQVCRQVQGGLSAKLGDDPYRLFLLIDAQHILQGQGLKIQLVRSVIVCGYRLRVTVDDNGLKSQLFQCQGGMDTAIVEFNTLANAVRTASQDHDLGPARPDRIFVRGIIGGIIIGTVLGTAYMDALPGFLHSQEDPAFPDLLLRKFQQDTQVLI